MTIALASDLHDQDGGWVIDRLRAIRPDLICISGDLTQRLDLPSGADGGVDGKIDHTLAFAFLTEACAIAPVVYAPGNHEMGSCKGEGGDMASESARANLARIAELGAIYLQNRMIDGAEIGLPGLIIGGCESGYHNPAHIPDLSVVDAMVQSEGFKLLLCHHPEYYPKYLKSRNLDLILSGHAHGGQIRLFGRGLYAPCQGILPRYDGGMYDGKLIVGRGLANTVAVPRLFNPRELVVVEISNESV